jgi:hypothetical protein
MAYRLTVGVNTQVIENPLNVDIIGLPRTLLESMISHTNNFICRLLLLMITIE